ncbi:hypothetical protein F5Y16DRAFT_356504 [Xylariaceae sp. FL0255]|nr:hypothetical protein F5Y16DRAFT_356504 [Xylariaceae sp. FL0255]
MVLPVQMNVFTWDNLAENDQQFWRTKFEQKQRKYKHALKQIKKEQAVWDAFRNRGTNRTSLAQTALNAISSAQMTASGWQPFIDWRVTPGPCKRARPPSSTDSLSQQPAQKRRLEPPSSTGSLDRTPEIVTSGPGFSTTSNPQRPIAEPVRRIPTISLFETQLSSDSLPQPVTPIMQSTPSVDWTDPTSSSGLSESPLVELVARRAAKAKENALPPYSPTEISSNFGLPPVGTSTASSGSLAASQSLLSSSGLTSLMEMQLTLQTSPLDSEISPSRNVSLWQCQRCEQLHTECINLGDGSNCNACEAVGETCAYPLDAWNSQIISQPEQNCSPWPCQRCQEIYTRDFNLEDGSLCRACQNVVQNA